MMTTGKFRSKVAGGFDWKVMRRIVCFIISISLFTSVAFASGKENSAVHALYQSDKQFGISDQESVAQESISPEDTIGKMELSAEELLFIAGDEYDTYLVKSGSSVQFSYVSIKDLTKPITLDEWGLENEGTSRIGGYDWKRGIGKGGILVQKSYDREKWETVYTNTDVFKEYSGSLTNFFSASRSDIVKGCYYKVIIAYQKAIKLTDTSFIGLWDTSEYKRAYCVEAYDMFLASSEMSDSVNVSVSASPDSGLDEKAAVYGSGAVASHSIGNQIAGQEQFVTVPYGGKGFAAEAANIQNETINSIGTGNKVTHTGANNAPNGPDYIIENSNGNIIQIQTKYYQTAKATIEACFDADGYRYMLEPGKSMQIEVPKDQYDSAVALMKEKILNNQLPGISDPNEAENIVRKGSVTYQQAVNIAKAGTIDSLVYDAKNGIVTSTVSMGISAVIQFAASLWNHEDIKTALKASLFTSLRTLGNTFVISVLSSQLGRTGLQTLLRPGSLAVVELIGPKASAVIVNAARIGLKPIYGAAAMKSAAKLLRSNVVTAIASFVVFAIPDTVDLIRGRISVKQMLKNSAASIGGIGGMFGGVAAGAAIGSIFPGPGNLIGGIIGGIAGGIGGSIGVKALSDLIAEDDAKEMLEIITMEFQNIAEEYLLNQEEAEKAVALLQEKLDANKLKDMYASGTHHKFARDLIQPFVNEVIKTREKVTLPSEEEIKTELVSTLEEIYDELSPEQQAVTE